MSFRVKLSLDVYRYCYQHALSTQAEEIMGLLIGEMVERTDSPLGTFKEKTLEIIAFKMVVRSDKRPDRVEISPDQMISATEAAEKLAKKLKRPNIRVVGWYHSHPNITVMPSHVDLRTQFNYQRMDKFFVGLIFAVYNTDKKTFAKHYRMLCFQAKENNSRFAINPLEMAKIKLDYFNIENPIAHSFALKEISKLSENLSKENVLTGGQTSQTQNPVLRASSHLREY